MVPLFGEAEQPKCDSASPFVRGSRERGGFAARSLLRGLCLRTRVQRGSGRRPPPCMQNRRRVLAC